MRFFRNDARRLGFTSGHAGHGNINPFNPGEDAHFDWADGYDEGRKTLRRHYSNNRFASRMRALA